VTVSHANPGRRPTAELKWVDCSETASASTQRTRDAGPKASSRQVPEVISELRSQDVNNISEDTDVNESFEFQHRDLHEPFDHRPSPDITGASFSFGPSHQRIINTILDNTHSASPVEENILFTILPPRALSSAMLITPDTKIQFLFHHCTAISQYPVTSQLTEPSKLQRTSPP
jgi:hypothetical protein